MVLYVPPVSQRQDQKNINKAKSDAMMKSAGTWKISEVDTEGDSQNTSVVHKKHSNQDEKLAKGD